MIGGLSGNEGLHQKDLPDKVLPSERKVGYKYFVDGTLSETRSETLSISLHLFGANNGSSLKVIFEQKSAVFRSP